MFPFPGTPAFGTAHRESSRDAEAEKIPDFEAKEFLCDPKTCILDKGSYGVAVLGKHRALGDVTVKCFSSEYLQSFQDELKLMRMANHEHIARVYGWTEWHLSRGIVMQYYEGGTLGKLALNQEVEIHPLLRLRMALQISQALVFLNHFFDAKILIISDLKADSVLLTYDFNCKLGDFGTCAVFSSKTSPADVFVGKRTERFSAPEVLDSPSMPPTPFHVIYSFGMVLYVLLARVLPFEDSFNRVKVVMEKQRPDCNVIETYKKSLPDDDAAIMSLLQDLMQKCWDHSPRERPLMIVVSEELQKSFDRQDQISVLIKVTQLFKQIKRDVKTANQEQVVPLNRFSTQQAKFEDRPPSPVQPNQSPASPTDPILRQLMLQMLLHSPAYFPGYDHDSSDEEPVYYQGYDSTYYDDDDDDY